MRPKIRIALALVAAAASVAVGLPAAAQAAPVTDQVVAVQQTAPVASAHVAVPRTDDGFRRHRRFGRFGFGFPVVSPFLFGGGFSSGFGFDGGFGGGGCQIFLWTGDINSYILCRVG